MTAPNIVNGATTADELISTLIDQWYFHSDIHVKAKLLRFARELLFASKPAVAQTPRYTEWLHLRAHGQWSNGVPSWARDHCGQMNDFTAAQAVIEELAGAYPAAAQGWKLVPVDPTELMAVAPHAALVKFNPSTVMGHPVIEVARECYRAMLAASPAAPAQSGEPVARVAGTKTLYVDCHECVECGHIGINDSHPTDASCGYSCDWTGPSPVDDKCPGCQREGVMGLACPKCSGRYNILAEAHISYAAPQPAQTETALTEHLYVLSMNEETMEEAIQAFEGSAAGEALKCVLHAQKQLRAILTTARPASRGDHAE